MFSSLAGRLVRAGDADSYSGVARMPNGGSSLTDDQLDALFRPYETAVQSFVRRHNVLLGKYYHGSECWDLCFAHPRGGYAKISIIHVLGKGFRIFSTRWQDDYRSYTRRLKSSTPRPCPSPGADLDQALEEELEEVLSWSNEDWSEAVSDYKRSWSRYSEAEFTRMAPEWPTPQ